MYRSLSDFIKRLELDGELIRVDVPVSSEYEIAELTDRQAKSPNGGKALLFTSTDRSFPVLTNMMGSERRICAALGVESLNELTSRLDSLLSSVSKPKDTLGSRLAMLPLLKEASAWFPKKSCRKGVCQEVVLKGSDASLSLLPILKCWENDGGRFVTLPMVHTVDPETGLRNVGMYRMQVYDDYSTGMHWHIHKTGARHFEKYRKQGKIMPVSVAIGGDPVYAYSATAPLPEGVDEYLLAGFLRKKPVSLVKCITNDLLVPADCDFVIEGYVDPKEAPKIEGAFGDHTGFYSLPDPYPVFHVTAITHRRNAVYPATVVGIPPQEDAWISKATERIFVSPIRFALFPEIKEIRMPEAGVSHNLVICSAEQSYPGHGVKLAQGLWGAGQMMFNKCLCLIPAAVDPFDDRAIFRLLRNCDPERCTFLSEGIYDILDHSTSTQGFGGKVLIDLMQENSEKKEPSTGEMSLPQDLSCSTAYLKELSLLILYAEPDKEVPFLDTLRDCAVNCNFILVLDRRAEGLEGSDILWIACANTDPRRDFKFENGTLIIDARPKIPGRKDNPGRFPNICSSSMETINDADRKWDKYGFPSRVESPSRRYRRLLIGDGMEVSAKNGK